MEKPFDETDFNWLLKLVGTSLVPTDSILNFSDKSRIALKKIWSTVRNVPYEWVDGGTD